MSELDLTPTDGLTNSTIRFARLDVLTNGGATLWFAFTDEKRNIVGEVPVDVSPTSSGTTDALIAAGHVKMANMLRQWLYVTDKLYSAYAGRAPSGTSGT